MMHAENKKELLELPLELLIKEFEYACITGNLDIISYIYSLEKFNQLEDLTLRANDAFYTSCFLGKLEVVKYWLDTNQKIDLYHQDNRCLKEVIKEKNIKIWKYLVNEEMIVFKEDVSNLIKENELAKQVVELHLLNKKLNSTLSINAKESAKYKI